MVNFHDKPAADLASPHGEQAAQGPQQARTGQTHDDAGQQHAAHAGNEHVLELHVQDGARQRAGPGTGARQRDAHEQQQRQMGPMRGLW